MREDQEAVQGIQAHLRFDSSAGPRVTEQFPEAFISGEGFLDVRTVFYTKAYAISVILSYSAKVEIISPPELKDELRRSWRKSVNVMNDGSRTMNNEQ